MNSLFLFLIFVIALGGVSGCASWNAEKKAPMIGESVEIDGHRFHAVDAGPKDSARPAVVLIHGASVNLRDMKIALGDELSRDRRVLMLDRPGRGYSDRPDGSDSLETQAQAVRALVQHYGLERPVIVGQSYGGAVALSYALQYQDDMAGLVLLAPVSHEWPGGVAWYNNVSGIPVLGFLMRRFVIPVYGNFAAKSGMEESFAPDDPPPNYAERSGLALLFRSKDFKANAADLVALKEEIIDQQGRYDELNLPVAIVVGEDDDTVSPEIHSKTLATEIDGASLLVLSDTGHALHHAETEKIIAVIEEISAQGAVSQN